MEDSSYGHGPVGEVNLTMEVMDADSAHSEAKMEMSHHDKSSLREREAEDVEEKVKSRQRRLTSREIRITPGSESRFGPGITATETQSMVCISQRSRIPSKTMQEPGEPGKRDRGGVDLEKFV
jgi:hypothetical protein